MSSHLRHLVVDLINDVKSTSDAQSKLYLLEQIREICLHRDKSALRDSVADMADFVLEKPMSIRKFIVRFFNEAMIQDPDCVFPHYLTVLQYYINESNDTLLTLLAKSFNSYYESVLLKIIHMTAPAATKSPSGLDPPQLWQTFCGLVARFHDFVSSSRSEQLRTNCLKICESVMIFGLPNQQLTVTSDPRLARKDPRLNRGAASKPADSAAAAAGPSSSSTAQTVEEISLHHPFVSKTEIQRVAEDYFTKVLLWSGTVTGLLDAPAVHPSNYLCPSALRHIFSCVCRQRRSTGLPLFTQPDVQPRSVDSQCVLRSIEVRDHRCEGSRVHDPGKGLSVRPHDRS